MGRPKKITAEVSSYIETLSSLDSTLTNFEIRNLISPGRGATELC
jgi:hypothetical protein